MRSYWPDESTPDTIEMHLSRRNLVSLFNQTVGQPGSEALEMQEAFICGKMTYEEAISFVRYAEYMVSASNDRSCRKA
jgi:hypothetical protein